MRRKLSGLTVRDWVVGIGSLLFAFWAAHMTYVGNIVAERVGAAESAGERKGHDAVQDLEIASVQGWQKSHDSRTAPLIDEMIGSVRPAVARIPVLEAKLDETNRLVREMHTFLVDRYSMPTAMPVLPGPYLGPVIVAAPPPPQQPLDGFIAGEVHR